MMTSEQKDFIRSHYPAKRPKWIAEQLGLNPNAVSCFVRRERLLDIPGNRETYQKRERQERAERVRKICHLGAARNKALVRTERLRALSGERQLTERHFTFYPNRFYTCRYRLVLRGYIKDPGGDLMKLYYDENTNRISLRPRNGMGLEDNVTQKYGITFHPVSELQDDNQESNDEQL